MDVKHVTIAIVSQFTVDALLTFAEDSLNVIKPDMLVGPDGRPVQRARRRFSIRENNKQIKA